MISKCLKLLGKATLIGVLFEPTITVYSFWVGGIEVLLITTVGVLLLLLSWVVKQIETELSSNNIDKL